LAGQISGGELQTLISTLQNGNTQLGHIFQALGGVASIPALSASISALAAAATPATSPMQIGALAARTGGAGLAAPLPDAPEGYITIDIPGVGPRLIPYYPVS
jgi:hypothetical protein